MVRRGGIWRYEAGGRNIIAQNSRQQFGRRDMV